MMPVREKTIILLGSISRGTTEKAWECIHYLIGLRRLGYDAFYVESPAGDEQANPAGPRVLDRILSRFGFANCWACHPQGSKIGFGISSSQLKRMYHGAALIIRLLDAAPPTPEQLLTNRLICIQGEPVADAKDRRIFRIKRPPIVCDLWHPFGKTTDNAHAAWHLWAEAEGLLQVAPHGIRHSHPQLSTCDDYRDYLCSARGELLFATEYSISHRTACYLAAGRPVIARDLPDDLPTGHGLLSFSDTRHAAKLLQAVESDYASHSRAAAELAAGYFNSDKVLGDLLEHAGLPRVAQRDVTLPKLESASEIHHAPDFSSAMRVDGVPGFSLIISGLGDGDTGGGLYSLDGQDCHCIDRLSSTGLSYENGNLHRVLWSDQASSGELLTYDRNGVCRYCRVDSLIDPHDLMWDGTHFLVVSTGTNSVLWITTDGQVARRWTAPGDRDAWHLNCLLKINNRLCVSAFGRFDQHRGWAGKLKTEKPGILFDLQTGEDLAGGLSAPHSPRMLDGSLLICNSAEAELLQIKPATGQIDRRLKLTGWTRGLAVTDDLFLIGESANRQDTSMGLSSAQVTLVCRHTWRVLHRFPIPCREVYDLVLVPTDLLDGLQRGFRNNPLRMGEQDQYALFRNVGIEPKKLWAISEPLSKNSLRISIRANPINVMRPAQRVELKAVLRNDSAAIFVNVPPVPVRGSYRWIDPATGARLPMSEPPRGELPRSLPPGESTEVVFDVIAPRVPGTYILRLTLVQEDVFWFDDVDARNVCDLRVDVVR